MSMTSTQAKHQLRRVFTVCPSFGVQLAATGDGNATLDNWAAIVATCHQGDLEAVVDEIVNGSREPIGKYQKFDMLPFNLREWSSERSGRREDKAKQQTYHQDARRKRTPYGRKETASLVVKLGAMVRSGDLSREENAERLEYLIEVWDKDPSEPDPDWLDDVRQSKGGMWTSVRNWKL